MTEVYQSVSTTNEVEDKYAKNEAARKALFGPLSVVIKCIGFDQTFSLLKPETRGRCIAWISTPLAFLGVVVLILNVFAKFDEIKHFLTWYWGETMVLTFLGVQSAASAIILWMHTSSLFYLRFYEGWSECTKLAEKKEGEKENGKENGDPEMGESDEPSPSSPRNSNLSRWVIAAFLLFTGTSIVTSTKYALYGGHNGIANETATTPLLDKVGTLEPLLSLWAALLSATCLSVYGVLHGIMQDTIGNFNKDLKAASESKTLSSRINSFSTRHQSILVFSRLLSSEMGGFTTHSVLPAIVVNFSAMFVSIACKPFIGPLGYACFILWTLVAIGTKMCILFQAAGVQEKLNESSEILVADKEIWNGDIHVAQQSTMMLTKRRSTDTTVSFFKCLKLTPWIANGIMLIPPILGGLLCLLKEFGNLRI